jgi:hypothetical protein
MTGVSQQFTASGFRRLFSQTPRIDLCVHCIIALAIALCACSRFCTENFRSIFPGFFLRLVNLVSSAKPGAFAVFDLRSAKPRFPRFCT